jgi:hypothetical protein
MAIQPRLTAGLQRCCGRPVLAGRVLLVGVFVAGAYGGYFVAA